VDVIHHLQSSYFHAPGPVCEVAMQSDSRILFLYDKPDLEKAGQNWNFYQTWRIHRIVPEDLS